MKKLLFPITIIILAIPLVSHAGPLAEARNVHVRLEVVEDSALPTINFLSSFRSWLGTRTPHSAYPEPGTTFTVSASGYAPSPYQTDSTPCITAAGTRVREGTVASNFLPMGTILEINGNKYIVEDRMNKRYHKAVDIFFVSTSDALEFGRQTIDVAIVSYGQPGQSIIDPEIELVATPDMPDLGDRLKGQFYFVRRLASEFIGTRSAADVNRYDVDCLKETAN